jgi:hypothetical protein
MHKTYKIVDEICIPAWDRVTAKGAGGGLLAYLIPSTSASYLHKKGTPTVEC